MPRRALFAVVVFLFAAAPSKKDATALLLAACEEGKGDAILTALANGADPNARDEKKAPALVTVATKSLWGKEKAVIAAFVKAKADLNAADSFGTTPLMAAVATDRSQIIDALIAAGAKIEAKDKDQWTAVHYAVNSNRFSALDKLIAAKANINATADDKYNAVMMAIGGGRGGIAEKLVKAGAKFPATFPDGASALLHAVSGRDLQGVRVVLATNPKIDDPSPEDGMTPVAMAAWDGDPQIVMELLRAGANPSIKDKEGKTALDRAIQEKNTEVAALLGGPWEKPRPKGGQTISIPCPILGGTVESNLAVDGKALVFTTTFPKPMSYYFGGGHMNRAETAKRLLFDGSFVPAYYLDTDSNPKTGMKASILEKDAEGADYVVDYWEYGTSILLQYLNSKGEERQKQVYANTLGVNVKKGEEDIDLSELSDDDRPRAENDNGVLRSRVPLSLLKLKPGSAIRVTAKIGSCDAKSANVTLK